jgi:hypothetical protein
VEQPPDILPEFLYKGLSVSAETLGMIKADDYWENSLQMHFCSPVFSTASASLSSAVQASGMHTLSFSILLFISYGTDGAGLNVMLIIETSAARFAPTKFAPARKVHAVVIIAFCVQLFDAFVLQLTPGCQPQPFRQRRRVRLFFSKILAIDKRLTMPRADTCSHPGPCTCFV